MLMGIGVNVSGMTREDWRYLFSLTNELENHKALEVYEGRQDLDASVQSVFNEIQAKINIKLRLIKLKLIQLKTKNSEPLFEQFVACFEHDIGHSDSMQFSTCMTEHLSFNSCVRTENLYKEMFVPCFPNQLTKNIDNPKDICLLDCQC
jgi:hypothetical protein